MQTPGMKRAREKKRSGRKSKEKMLIMYRRVEDDVECYCDTLVSWSSVAKRFADVQAWLPYLSPFHFIIILLLLFHFFFQVVILR